MSAFTFNPAELRRRRIDAGLSRTQLGALVDRSEQTVKSYELGRAVPSMATIAALCRELDCEPQDLFVPGVAPKRSAAASRVAQNLAPEISVRDAEDVAALLSGRAS